jgi:hypothetical protein
LALRLKGVWDWARGKGFDTDEGWKRTPVAMCEDRRKRRVERNMRTGLMYLMGG